jgi:DNA-directed RNA polymerase specialized sigma24 family protein
MVSVDVLAQLQPSLLAKAVELSGDPVMAEDLLQETYVVLLEAPPRSSQGVDLERWMRTCMRNLWSDYLRGRPWPSQAEDFA